MFAQHIILPAFTIALLTSVGCVCVCVFAKGVKEISTFEHLTTASSLDVYFQYENLIGNRLTNIGGLKHKLK